MTLKKESKLSAYLKDVDDIGENLAEAEKDRQAVLTTYQRKKEEG